LCLVSGRRVVGLGFWVWCLVFRVSCFRLRDSGFGFRADGSSFGVSGSGFRVSVSGIRVLGIEPAGVIVSEGPVGDWGICPSHDRRCAARGFGVQGLGVWAEGSTFWQDRAALLMITAVASHVSYIRSDTL